MQITYDCLAVLDIVEAAERLAIKGDEVVFLSPFGGARHDLVQIEIPKMSRLRNIVLMSLPVAKEDRTKG
ncbi:hypothetical protein [Sphingomonas pollutisoli]|uniref:hypothetical protein n=1 Tax=Sphingomonas pollutisoli TaxID=3030829 RepID=UPI0023B8A76E|nr:hypothetical protein [Sphingomonas pollutisoli]